MKAGVELAEVEKWYPDLKATVAEGRRMALALSGSKDLTKELRLVDAETARDLFLLHCQTRK